MRIWFESPQWLALLLAVPVMVAVPLLVRSLAGLSGGRRWAALALRSAVMTALILCLAGLHWTQGTRKVSVVYVVDTSDSVPPNLRRAAEVFVHASKANMKPEEDKAGLIGFGGRAAIEQVPVPGEYTNPLSSPARPEQTDLAEAIRTAASIFPPDSAKRIVILSDGNQTRGDALAEAKRVAAAGVGIDVVPLDYSHDREVQVTNLWSPATARMGDEIPLKVSIFSRTAVEGELILLEKIGRDERPIDLDPSSPGAGLRVRLQPGKNAFVQHVRMTGGDVHRFTAQFRPLRPGDDSMPQNNRASAFTSVFSEGRVLVLSTSAQDDRLFVEAMRQENIDVEWRAAEDLPTALEEYQPYAAVVLSNVPADLVPKSVQEALASYARDLGGGLVMIGGDSSFGAGGWIGSPVEKVMPVDFEVKAKRQVPKGALALIMHSSEMPQGNYWAKKIAEAAVDALSRVDYVGVYAYDPMVTQGWAVPMQQAVDKGSIKRQIDAMNMGDMPDFDPGLIAATGALNGTDAAQKHIIIISDGDPQPASRGTISQLQSSKITVTTVMVGGHGSMVNRVDMQNLAKSTGGRFYEVNDPNTLPQIFVKEARTVTRALIHEKPFNVQLASTFGLAKGLNEREIPPLGGFVLTTPKPMIEMPLLAKTEEMGTDPLLAYWQIGLGRSVAFTSGMWLRWGPRWLAWEKFKPLWGQTVRWAMRKSGSAEMDVQAVIEEGSGRLLIDAVDKSAGYLNFLEFRGTLIDPDLKARPLDIVQTGPGRYEARFETDAPGTYIIGFAYRKAGEEGWHPVQTGLATSYSPEYAQLQGNPSLLEQIAEVGQGKVLPLDPAASNVFRRDLPEALTRKPAWPDLLALAIALFLLDVAVRRIAISPLAVLAYARAWLADLAGRWRAQAQRAEALGALKRRRQEVQEAWRERLKRTAPTPAEPAAQAQRRRFSSAEAAPPGERDFVSSVGASRDAGGARLDEPAGAAKDEADTAGRLLRAKRRAQQRMAEEAEDK